MRYLITLSGEVQVKVTAESDDEDAATELALDAAQRAMPTSFTVTTTLNGRVVELTLDVEPASWEDVEAEPLDGGEDGGES